MNPGINLSLLIIALSIYAVRLTPFIFLKGTIRSRFIRSVLFYVPYVTLAVMTFPAIITAAGTPAAGILALAVGLIVAWIWGDLFAVACSCCAVVFIVGLLI